MNSSIVFLICLIIGVVSAFPVAQAPAPAAPAPPPPGPFTTMFQAGGAVAGAQAQDLAKLFAIFPAAADSAFSVGQTVFGRFIAAAMGFAAGK